MSKAEGGKRFDRLNYRGQITLFLIKAVKEIFSMVVIVVCLVLHQGPTEQSPLAHVVNQLNKAAVNTEENMLLSE